MWYFEGLKDQSLILNSAKNNNTREHLCKRV